MGGGISGAYPDGIPLKAGWAMWYLWSLFIYSVITPRIVNRLGIKRLMFLSLLLVFLLGFKFVKNDFLDAQRVVNFYPFYVLGILLRKYEMNIYSDRIRKKVIWPLLFVLLTITYIVLCYYHNGFCYGTGFMGSHGLSLKGLSFRWLNYILVLIMSVCVIMFCPNRRIAITKYGSRTINVYLLHMSIIFPMCWWVMRPIMHDWYGYLIYLFAIPAVCSLLFSSLIDSIMNPILSYPERYKLGS